MLLTVGAGGITANDGAVITQPFDFVANQTWQRSGTGNGALEIAGSTSDGGVDRDLVLASNLGVANLGIVLRSGAGHYGTTTLKDGFFRMRHSSLGGSTVILDAATGAQRIQFGNEAGTGGESGTFGNPVQLTADREGAFHIWTNFTTTLSQPVTGGNAASVFRKTDGGALVLAADNTYPGATIIDAGTLQLGEGGTTGSLDVSASLTINGSGVLSIRRSGSTNLSAIVPGAAGANYAPFTANDGRINFSGPTQTDTLVIDQDLGTANTFGQLRVSSGTMTLPSGTDLQLRSL
jgi:autotransporter-associated beta strand protein